ncbi:YfiR family protein [Edwardsiella hoshinae]|nr:YfiR family protein [Edwardsiella hoshinae]
MNFTMYHPLKYVIAAMLGCCLGFELFCAPAHAVSGVQWDDNLQQQRERDVARIVTGMISFTRWRTASPPIRLCIIPPTRFARQLLSMPATPQLSVREVDFTPQAILQQCDAVYYGDVTPDQQQSVVGLLQGKSLLTIAENNRECSKGSAFCLQLGKQSINFKLNLDTLARSNIQVNPNVLLLAEKKG